MGVKRLNMAFVLVDEKLSDLNERLAGNPHYHAAAEVRLERVEHIPVEDPGTELARYRAGELDITETIPPGRHDWLRENLPEDLRIAPYLGSFWLGINLGREPLGVCALRVSHRARRSRDPELCRCTYRVLLDMAPRPFLQAH